MDLEAGSAVDRYRVIGRLGRGGMAVVYRVVHEQLGSEHALKLVMSPRQVTRDRLLQEGRAQSQLRHRNIVAVTDVVTVAGAPGLVMELIDGPTLEALLHEGLSIDQADHVARGLLAGVAAAHAAGVVHRDLKPSNVLMAWEDGTWIPKVADFGVAKVVHDEAMHATRTGAGLGTPRYMAPEQTRDASRVDARADVFSLGSILYELVTGDAPFGGSDLVELYQAIREGTYDPVRQHAPDAPDRMVRTIEGALVVDPDARTASVAELLRQWTDGTPAPTGLSWPVPEPSVRPIQPSLRSGSGSGSSETWGPTAPPAPARETVAVPYTLVPDGLGTVTGDPPVPGTTPAAAAGRRLRWLVSAGLVAGVLALGAAWWAVDGGADAPAYTVGPAPSVYVDPGVQSDLDRGWDALMEADLVTAERHFGSLTRKVPDDPLGWTLLAMSRAGQGQNGAAHQALWKATDRAEELEGAHGRMLRAHGRARRRGFDGELAEIGAVLDERPDDLVLLWLAQWTLPAEHAALRKRVEDGFARVADQRAYATFFLASHATVRGDTEVAERWLALGDTRYPGNPTLLSVRGELAVAQGDLEGARTALTEALRFAPGLFGARHRLAEVSLLLGREDETRALVTASMAPSEPVGQRTAFAYRMGLAYAGLGRVAEGHLRFREGAAAAETEGDYLSKGWLLGMVALIELDAERFDRASTLLEEMLSFAATTPEIPEGERAHMSRSLLEGRTFIASRRGDLETAEAQLERMRAVEGVRPESIEWVQRDLAAWRKDVAALEGLFELGAPGCTTDWERARALALAGARDAARSALEPVLADGACGLVGAERWAHALGLALAAELATDPSERAAHIAAFDALWPSPDADLPVVRRVAALRAP